MKLLTLWLAALCPFTAIYAANPLTEGPTLFALSLALWAAAPFRVFYTLAFPLCHCGEHREEAPSFRCGEI